MSGPRRLAILPALVRPELWLGCDRMGLILLGTIAAALGGPAGIGQGNYVVVGVAAVLFSLGTAGLRELAKREPFAREVFRRAWGYRSGYLACPRWDAGHGGRRRS
jgi:type IV secretory pathway TrbD component